MGFRAGRYLFTVADRERSNVDRRLRRVRFGYLKRKAGDDRSGIGLVEEVNAKDLTRQGPLQCSNPAQGLMPLPAFDREIDRSSDISADAVAVGSRRQTFELDLLRTGDSDQVSVCIE